MGLDILNYAYTLTCHENDPSIWILTPNLGISIYILGITIITHKFGHKTKKLPTKQKWQFLKSSENLFLDLVWSENRLKMTYSLLFYLQLGLPQITSST